MNTHSENVKEFGLFAFTCAEIARKKQGMPLSSFAWYAAEPKSKQRGKRVKGGGRPVAPTSKPVELPIKLIVPATINAVEEDIELPHEDTIVELVPSQPLAHEEAELVMDAAAGEEEMSEEADTEVTVE